MDLNLVGGVLSHPQFLPLPGLLPSGEEEAVRDRAQSICQVRSKGTQVLCPGGFALLPKAAEEEGMSESTQGTGHDRQKPWPSLTRYIFLVSGLDWALQSSSNLLTAPWVVWKVHSLLLHPVPLHPAARC